MNEIMDGASDNVDAELLGADADVQDVNAGPPADAPDAPSVPDVPDALGVDAETPGDDLDALIDSNVSDEDIHAFAADLGPPDGFREVLGAPLPPPPRLQPVGHQRRLLRDPGAIGAGVASGLGWYMDLDPVLVRIAFAVAFLFTGPLAVIAYVAGWILIPKAEVWPPTPSVRASSTTLSPRVVGLGILAVGGALILGFNGGVGGFIGPFFLVAVGVWLLRQPQRVTTVAQVPAPAENVGAMAAPGGAGAYEPAEPWANPAATAYPYAEFPSTSPYPGVGVPPAPQARQRSIVGRIFRVFAFGFMALMGLAMVFGLGAVVFIADSDTGVSFGENRFIPSLPGDLDPVYSLTGGSLTLDLTQLDDSMFVEPMDIEVNNQFGETVILVPSDLSVAVDASSDFGELEVFGTTQDGVDLSGSFQDDNPRLQIDIESNAGSVRVERADGPSAPPEPIPNIDAADPLDPIELPEDLESPEGVDPLEVLTD